MEPPVIPERISSLATPQLQLNIKKTRDQQKRHVSHMSNLSVASSNLSTFLEEKLQACEFDYEASVAQLAALLHVRDEGLIDAEEYGVQSSPLLNEQSRIIQEKRLLTDQPKLIEDDLDEELENKRSRQNEPEIDFYERAYVDTIGPRITAACGKMSKTVFNHGRFRQEVMHAYDAVKYDKRVKLVWCHLAGEWLPAENVKAAHLVPRALTHREVAYLFGVKEVPPDFFYDWKLGITLLTKFEQALDNGTIAIVPVADEISSRWKCVLLDESVRDIIATFTSQGLCRWRELDNKELEFQGTNRPAKRYLYFRFISTIIHAQKTGNHEVLDRLETKKFWASPGQYLRRSTLVTMARQISGLELPQPLFQQMTFVGNEEEEKDSDEVATLLSSELMNATIESAYASQKDSDGDGDSVEEEEEYS